jgi:hypothetical protein
MVMKIEKTTVVLVAETNFKRTLYCHLIRPQQTEDGKWIWRKGAMSMYSPDPTKPAARYFVWTEDAQGKLRGYWQPIESRQEALELYNRALIHLESVQHREAHGNNIPKEQETTLELLGYIKYNWHINRWEWITSPLTLR